MSIDAGGLAQMTYQSPFNNNIGVSGPGFASRGKGSHIKRLSVALPPKISTIDETQQVNACSTPRTSRGHLLAGLRTAPKSATTQHTDGGFGLESSTYADQQRHERIPQTTTGAFFPGHTHHGSASSGRHVYSLPEQVLAPPTIEIDGEAGEHMDQQLYDELIATNAYLAQQQRALQQQLLNITAASQQFGGLNLGGGMSMGGQQYQSPMSPGTSFYNHQFQQGLQPIVQAVPNSPGVFAVYNPMTGQSSFVVDNAAQQQHDMANAMSPQEQLQSPMTHRLNTNQHQHFSPGPEGTMSPSTSRARSPPKSTPSPPQDHEPLPPPSANAFRRGHKKSLSFNPVNRMSSETTKTGTPRSAGYPQTPMTGTFGPGQARAGEHPVRQPRGPPLLQELEEKPTSKHEGSKNFATRQRRRAVHDLVRAGRERRSEARQTGSGSGTPGSEADFTFSVSSDNDDGNASTGSLSSKPSIGSLRAAANGAIGSERKEKSRERSSVDSTGDYSATSLSSDEGAAVGGKMFEVESTRRKTPMLVLSSAEKRKSAIM